MKICHKCVTYLLEKFLHKKNFLNIRGLGNPKCTGHVIVTDDSFNNDT